MRTYTVVPSFQGESAYFDLPDLGFQGDHLSFAILFNLTELTEHWPNILPSMIVTDPKGNTYIAPHTSWNAEKHIFTWAISSTETTYEGYLMCQLKCISAEDPETIVCMSRICQARVYQSLEAASDPPEAFQTWIDTLVALGAEINADASVILESVETTETNARSAQAAAEEAALHKSAAQQARNQAEQTAQIATRAQEGATQALQRAQSAITTAEEARDAAVAAQQGAAQALESVDQEVAAARQASSSAADSAQQATTSMNNANTAKRDAEAARDAAVAAKGYAETAQQRAETAETNATSARSGAVAAQRDAESARDVASGFASAASDSASAASDSASAAHTDAEAAASDRARAEAAREGVENYSSEARKWAEGKDSEGQDVVSTDDQYRNNAKFWAQQAEHQAGVIFSYGLYVDEQGNGFIRAIEG